MQETEPVGLRVPGRHEAGQQVLENLGQEAYNAFMLETEPVDEQRNCNDEDSDDEDSDDDMPTLVRRVHEVDSSDDKDSDEEESDDEMPRLVQRVHDDDSSDEEESDDENQDDNEEEEFGGMGANPSTLTQLKGNPEYWIGDTGCTTHLSISKTGMINTKPIKKGNTSVVMGEGSQVTPKLNGDLVGTIYTKSGKEVMGLKLANVNYASNMQFNLFSLNSMMMKGWKLGGDKTCLSLTKNKIELKFDIKIPTQSGCLFVMYIIQFFTCYLRV